MDSTPDPTDAPTTDAELARAWLRAASDPGTLAELDEVYADIAAQVAARGPACWASGRCCHLEATGHRLYVTGLEAAATVRRLPPGVVLDETSLARAWAFGGCPFQAANICGVHSVKPVGCRVYFCDRSAHDWQARLSEHALAQVRAIHDHRCIPYRYGEWRAMLGLLTHAARP